MLCLAAVVEAASEKLRATDKDFIKAVANSYKCSHCQFILAVSAGKYIFPDLHLSQPAPFRQHFSSSR